MKLATSYIAMIIYEGAINVEIFQQSLSKSYVFYLSKPTLINIP